MYSGFGASRYPSNWFTLSNELYDEYTSVFLLLIEPIEGLALLLSFCSASEFNSLKADELWKESSLDALENRAWPLLGVSGSLEKSF